MRFKESPEPCPEGQMPPGSENKVMHSMFRVGETMLMASDCHCKGQPKFEGISLALSPKTVAAAEKLFAALSDGGTVCMPLGKTFWSPAFGVVTDKFGLSWMISVMA
jgi:PhnB protein